MMNAIQLRTAGLINPMGIDLARPELCWQCADGMYQTAFQLRAHSGQGVWDSGIVESSAMQLPYGGQAASRDMVCWQVRLRDEANAWGDWSQEARFEFGLLSPDDFTGKLIDPELNPTPNQRQPASALRRRFSCTPGKIARAYITAQGCYEAFLNGQRVGDFLFAPGPAEYEVNLPYQTYDISALLRAEENELLVTLADGWYRSAAGVEGQRNQYGEHLGLYAQIEVDGHSVCVTDEQWQASQSGSILESDLTQGERYDANRENPSQWHGVHVLPLDKTRLHAWNAVPIRAKEQFPGKRFTAPNGETVYDFGQNLAGFCSLTVTARGGEVITLTHGEALDENGNFTIQNFQPGSRHKEGGIFQRVTYICKPGKNVFRPHFSFFGFRYVKVEYPEALTDLELTAIAVYSDMEQRTEFSCGVEAVNQLFRNSVWSQKSNFCGVPTDCPTREKAGWTGDAGVFANTGLYLMDCATVLEHWLAACRANQFPDGKIRNINPKNNAESFFGKLLAGSAGWGDAVILVPWALYRHGGDKRVLEENYDMMTRWLSYLQKRAGKASLKGLFDKNPYKDSTITSGIDYGEWCEPDLSMREGIEQNGTGGTATAYLSYSAGLLSQIAEILGKAEDSAKFAEISRRAARGYQYAHTDHGAIHSRRQKDYVRPLAFGLLEEKDRPAAAQALDALVKECGYHLNTGFLSTPWLCPVLAEYGYADTAYRLLLQDTAPSWLYAVKKGATTIWETWTGIDEAGKVSASLNHYSYGAVCGFLMENACGIRYSTDTLLLKPIPSRRLGHAKSVYHSSRGDISSEWLYEGNTLRLTFTLPPNVTARTELPNGTRLTLEPGKHSFTLENV